MAQEELFEGGRRAGQADEVGGGEVAVDEVAVDPISIDPIEIGRDSGFTPEQIAMRDADVAAMTAGFDAAGVDYTSFGESPWVSVVFDLTNPASVEVIAGVLARE